MDTIYLILLRTIHILAGVLWVGGSVIYIAFIEPTVKATAPASQKFMQHFMGRQRYALFMNVTSGLTVLAGVLLYWRDTGGQILEWIQTGPGLGFTLGALFAIAVYLLGFFMIRPRAERLMALGKQIGMAGGPPTPEQATELSTLDREMGNLGRVDAVLLIISLVLMSTARYWIW
jgi:uncharacterized membrane protein